MKMIVRTINGPWRGVLIFFLIFCCSAECFSEPLKVIYPIASEKDTRTDYLVGVLNLALQKSGIPYSLEAAEVEMTHSRKISSVAQGIVSVIWTAASSETEKRIDPIKIPIYGGLMGYRVFIINQKLQPALADVKSMEELQTFSVGAGIGWISVDLLKNAGFNVSVAKYESLFKMVNIGRFDLFPRGIQEAFAETQAHGAALPSLAVEKYIGLHYDNAVFIYVRKGNSRLKNAIQTGLGKAYEDGSFKQFFQNHPFIKSTIERADFIDRRWFEIENPYFNKDDQKAVQKYYDRVSFGQ